MYQYLDPRRIIIIYSGSSSSSSSTSTFQTTPKRPAGEVSSELHFTLYLGGNTGPYKTAENNGTVILPPIPVEWIIAPLNVTAGQCPDRAQNLQLFGIINAIVAGLVLLLGCRPLVRYLTGGVLGSPTRFSPFWTWLVSFGLQVAANAVVSRLVVATPGYEHLSMLHVFALYASRPRINQIWTGLLRLFVGPVRIRHERMMLGGKKRGRVRDDFELGAAGGSATSKPKSRWSRWVARVIPSRTGGSSSRENEQNNRVKFPFAPAVAGPRGEEEWVYTDSYVATSVSELFLQLMSAVFVGVTWRRFPNEPIREHMQHHVNFMLAAPALALVGWLLIPIYIKRDESIFDGDTDGVTWEGSAEYLLLATIFLGLTGFFTYGVAWRYWAEFLMLPGSLWCPPKFIEQAAVWSSFSGLAAFFGGGL
ncbi:hypothetical protein N657DRAFT_675685 [Parathielavia appendiculata]|uniref:Uncharacterized protein n=1 Tax=Parathielavia appendiculata TaxID=2587402 RepID=A0AAN6TPF3_9PEZI|nr:hypothetical protein N657DRAFT_675685 [Parathielavia appendiculata]